MYAVFQAGRKEVVKGGGVGHVDYGKATLSKSELSNDINKAQRNRTNKSDRKRDRANRWR